MKLDKETDEEGKKRGVSMERSTAGTKKKEVPTAYHILIKIQNNNKDNMVIFYTKWKKYNEI